MTLNRSGYPPMNAVIPWIFLFLLAIFPVSGTIALRNIVILVLMLLMIWYCVFSKVESRKQKTKFLADISWPIILWVVLLLVFPLWAHEGREAWKNLGGQWLESLLVGFIGYAVYRCMGNRGPGLLALAVASSAPLFIHLILCIAAVLGLLDAGFYAEPSLATVWSSLLNPGGYSQNPHLGIHELMLGFRGVEPMHGNLGYPACQAICLYVAAYVMALREKGTNVQLISVGGSALCLLSILIAQSRGALLYAIAMMAIGYFIYRFQVRQEHEVVHISKLSFRAKAIVSICALLMAAVGFQYVRHDKRWFYMLDSVESGFLITDPINVLCNGMDVETEAGIRSRLMHLGPEHVHAVIAGMNSDGGRVLILRGGFQLMLENPAGLDGSRHSYQKLIKERCGHEPVMQFAHTHNAWIDLALALGWIGALIFANMMLFFVRIGWKHLHSKSVNGWAVALTLVSLFWILRGFADSVYREHYLQMQLMLLMYVYAHLIAVWETDETTLIGVDKKRAVITE